jgi:hypothetical protein
MIQNLIVVLIILVTVGFTVRSFVKSLKKPATNGCEGCNGCALKDQMGNCKPLVDKNRTAGKGDKASCCCN